MDVGAMKMLVAAHQDELAKAMGHTRPRRSLRGIVGRFCIRVGVRLVGPLGRSGSLDPQSLRMHPSAP